MKKGFLFFSISLAFAFSSCGPAAEDRDTMHSRAKVIGDSIANILKTSMDEAAKPGPIQPAKIDTSRKNAADTAKKTK